MDTYINRQKDSNNSPQYTGAHETEVPDARHVKVVEKNYDAWLLPLVLLGDLHTPCADLFKECHH